MALFGRGGQGGGDSRERTAADREAARLERERRRALREGRIPPSAPESPGEEPAAHEPPAPEAPAAHEPPAPEPPAPELPAAEPYDEHAAPHGEDAAADDEHAAPHGEDAAAHDEHVAPHDEHLAPHDEHAAPHHEHLASQDEPQATQQWASEPQGEEQGARHVDEWGWDDEPQSPAPVPAPARRHDDGEDGGQDEEILDQPTVAFTPEEEQAATTPPPPPAAPSGPVGGRPGRRTVQLPRARGEEVAEDGHHYEAPIGTRRGGRPYEPQPGAPPPGHRQLTVPRRGHRWRLILGLLALLVVVLVALFFVFKLLQPGKGEGTGSVRVVIPTGSTASQIGDRLAKAGVVDSGFFFDLRTRLSGHRGDLRAGSYTLKRDMSYAAAIDALTRAPKAVPVINATLPEGPSRRELAPIVKQAGVRGSYLKATASSSKLNPRNYGAPRGTRSLEGFLYPATYELRRSDATATNLVDKQIAAFKQNFKNVDLKRARKRNLNAYDVLIIASMIEREARIARERPLVAAVIYNRLRQGIPLGIDATIRYHERNWTQPLRVSELQRDSPYNTRMHQGLPPTPIGNPGLESMRAAAAPAKVDYLYYVVKPCGNGAHNFSSTDAQFQRDVAAYNRKRDELGGKDPSTCKK